MLKARSATGVVFATSNYEVNSSFLPRLPTPDSRFPIPDSRFPTP
ncbi:hypothetical protein [Moorena sp. SIO2C4]|nr:hypothetical protein [Moorena sp. SIO2C4]